MTDKPVMPLRCLLVSLPLGLALHVLFWWVVFA